jgi:catechol 2,3-dioxygenase-like lactoylglutathione lyase family enzyme
MFEKIALISIPVKDQKRSKTFYTDVLGCSIVQEMPFGTPGTQWIRLALPTVETDLTLVTWFPQMKPGSVQGLVLITKDIESTHLELRRRGLKISKIKDEEWAREATFSDPDGNGWVLQQSTVRERANR